MGKLSVAILVASLLAVVGSLCAQFAFPPPRLLIENPEFDFGEADAHSDLQHTFLLKNTGGRPLELLKLKPNCTCTKADLAESVLQPGQSTELTMHLHVKKSNAPMIAKTTIFTNDPNSPAEVRLLVRSRYGLQVTPTFVDFGSQQSQSISQVPFDLSVLTDAGNDFSVQLWDLSDEPPLEAVIDRSGDRPRVAVSLSPTTPIGPLTASVTLSSQDDSIADLNVPVRGEVVGPVRFLPKTAYLGLLKQDDDLIERVEILAAQPESEYSSRVIAVSSRLKGLLEAHAINDGDRRFVELRISPKVFEAERHEFSGAVVLQCEGDIEARLKLPVRFFVLPESNAP